VSIELPPPADLAAALTGRYELRRPLGQGGMATVYLAHDRKHHRDVALKVLLPGLAAQLGVDRFLTEIRVAARLTHPHIVGLHDSGEAAGFLYYVMPYIEGGSLRQRITAQTPLTLDQALAIANPVADGLTYAHRMGIYHRDIKPENILFSQGHPMVADFGIAKAISTAGGTNLRTSGPLGTPGYMSPEQAAGLADLDGRADVYSLAVVIYEMLVCEIPGSWPSEESMRAGRLLDIPAPHRARLAAAGAAIEAALVSGLAMRREHRTATPAALVQALRSPDAASRRRYSEQEVQDIVRGAAEREAVAPEPADSMTLGGVVALAGEVGIAPEAVQAAARHLPARFRAVAYSPWQLMDSQTPAEEGGWTLFDVLSFVFFSIITAGVLPLVFIGLSRQRKRRLKPFFQHGEPALADIVDFREEEIGFGSKLTRVRYEFEAGGRTQRGSDLVLPYIADRWRAGERIEVLYLAERNYDSVIVGGH